MAATSIFKDNAAYYAPAFQLTVNEQKLDPMVLRDVTQITYHDKLDELDSVEMTINNWDQAQFKPKYEPPSLKKYEGIFEPGAKIGLILGYAATTSTDRLM